MTHALIFNRKKDHETYTRSVRSTHTVCLHLGSTQSIVKDFHSLHPDYLSPGGVEERIFHGKSGRFVPSFPMAHLSQRSIVGMRCNYRVTYNDCAWNTFLKKGSLVSFA